MSTNLLTALTIMAEQLVWVTEIPDTRKSRNLLSSEAHYLIFKTAHWERTSSLIPDAKNHLIFPFASETSRSAARKVSQSTCRTVIQRYCEYMPTENFQMLKPVHCSLCLEAKATRKLNMLPSNVSAKPKLHAVF